MGFFDSTSSTLQTSVAPTSPVSATVGGSSVISTPIGSGFTGGLNLGGGKKSNNTIQDNFILSAAGGSTMVADLSKTYAPAVTVISNSPDASATTSPQSGAALDWKTIVMFAIAILGGAFIMSRR